MDIFQQLERDEGRRKFPYVDTKGKVTIGIGWNLTDDGMSDSEIDTHFIGKVGEVIAELSSRLPWFQALDPVRQAVFVNMAFNLGLEGLEEFQKLLMAAARGDWETAAAETLHSSWAAQVGDRAKRLAQQIQTGEWV